MRQAKLLDNKLAISFYSWLVQDGSESKSRPMIGENRRWVTNEPVEVQDCRKITDHFRGIYRIHPNSIKENRRMSSTCNLLDLQTLGPQLIIMP